MKTKQTIIKSEFFKKNMIFSIHESLSDSVLGIISHIFLKYKGSFTHLLLDSILEQHQVIKVIKNKQQ